MIKVDLMGLCLCALSSNEIGFQCYVRSPKSADRHQLKNKNESFRRINLMPRGMRLNKVGDTERTKKPFNLYWGGCFGFGRTRRHQQRIDAWPEHVRSERGEWSRRWGSKWTRYGNILISVFRRHLLKQKAATDDKKTTAMTPATLSLTDWLVHRHLIEACEHYGITSLPIKYVNLNSIVRKFSRQKVIRTNCHSNRRRPLSGDWMVIKDLSGIVSVGRWGLALSEVDNQHNKIHSNKLNTRSIDPIESPRITPDHLLLQTPSIRNWTGMWVSQVSDHWSVT